LQSFRRLLEKAVDLVAAVLINLSSIYDSTDAGDNPNVAVAFGFSRLCITMMTNNKNAYNALFVEAKK
jgi:hypothetical protein